jgi:hypothetical protein
MENCGMSSIASRTHVNHLSITRHVYQAMLDHPTASQPGSWQDIWDRGDQLSYHKTQVLLIPTKLWTKDIGVFSVVKF